MTVNSKEIGRNVTSLEAIREKHPTEVLGPCLVRIESPLVTHIRFRASKAQRSNYNTKYVLYPMDLFNGKNQIGIMGVCQSEQPYNFSAAQEARDFVEPEYRKVYQDVFTYEICNGCGSVTIGRKLTTPGSLYKGFLRIPFKNPKEKASFQYKINDLISVNGVFYLSQEEAMKLLDSIHVELR